MWRRRKLVLTAATVAALVAAAIASADNLQIQGVDSSGVATAAPGGSVAIEWRIHEIGNDGCNADPATPVVVSVSPSGPVTPSDSTLTFTSCETWQSVTFTVNDGAAPGEIGRASCRERGERTVAKGSYGEVAE